MAIHLQSGSLALTFCGKTGVLYGLTAIETGWEIINRREIGLSWRILLPLSDELRNNDILGEEQVLDSYDARVTFIWKNVRSRRGGVHDITVTLTVRAQGRRIVYDMDVDNRSPYTVENVYCPYLGDLARPQGAPWLKAFSHVYAHARDLGLWPQFENNVGYFGADYPTQIGAGVGAPETPFTLLRTPNQGLYMGVSAPSSDFVAWFGELRPGWDSSIDSRVPESTDIAGKPVQIRYAALHLPYILPGEHRAVTPIALEAYQGGWQQGADIYAAWRKTWMKPATPPAWAREPHAWLQLHINSPEDELRLRFNELPKVAGQCKRHGIAAIQLVGWNDGGQDQGNPSHNPDPRLGTFDELKEAIRVSQEMGVHIILFAKFTWADRGTKRFRDELNKMAVRDPYGDYYTHGGYRYQTGTQLLDINTKRLIPMCFGSEAYMRVCEQEFSKILALGADGMLYDECQHHSPTHLCFDTSHGHRYGWPTYSKDRELIQRLRQVPGFREDFLFAGEACYDWEMEAYHLAYFRSEQTNYLPLARYLLPGCQYMTAVTGFNDRNMLNQCLMYRFTVSFEPYNFKGMPDDYPDTMQYGAQMHALREEFRKWFWDGEFRGTDGASALDMTGRPYEPYGVFKAADHSLGVVVCNYGDAPQTVAIRRADGKTFERYRLVDDSRWRNARGGVVLPARSAAIALMD
ncbi:MAG TPA: DUF6259 domain-containing protein [Clostridia bacterium]|nr:DUF6259 domain-containing protein [Clostridia bacterium]